MSTYAALVAPPCSRAAPLCSTNGANKSLVLRTVPASAAWLAPQQPPRRKLPPVAAGKDSSGSSGNFGDELLDFMYAGKKLRKWYGQEGQVLPRDGREPGSDPDSPEEPEEEEPAVREHIAVLDADSCPMAEQVVLQLILNRAKIRALVKDAAAAKQGFGPYIEPVQGDSGDRAALKRLLKGAQAAVVCGPLGALLPAAAATKLPHIVLLSSAGAPQQGFSLFASAEQRALCDAQREAAVKQSGLSYTVVRVASLAGVPGGASRLALTAASGPPQGQVSREDAAKALAEAAARDATAGSLEVQLAATGAGEPPEDWQAAFADLLSGSPSAA